MKAQLTFASKEGRTYFSVTPQPETVEEMNERAGLPATLTFWLDDTTGLLALNMHIAQALTEQFSPSFWAAPKMKAE